MSNPTFSTGNLTRKAGKPVEKFHLVKLVDGKVEHADEGAALFGVVTADAAPATDREKNVLAHLLPENVRVHTSQCVVKIATDGDIAEGAEVYAAADGKVAASGSVKVGIADRATKGGLTLVHLFHPSVYIAASA